MRRQSQGTMHFNTSYVTVQPSRMARFMPYIKFQYILCYGSTLKRIWILPLKTYFNTSYVTVQLLLVLIWLWMFSNFNTSYVTVQLNFLNKSNLLSVISIHLMLRFNFNNAVHIPNINKISIHLMLRFNAKEEKPVILLLEFQYILCYGSTL